MNPPHRTQYSFICSTSWTSCCWSLRTQCQSLADLLPSDVPLIPVPVPVPMITKFSLQKTKTCSEVIYQVMSGWSSGFCPHFSLFHQNCCWRSCSSFPCLCHLEISFQSQTNVCSDFTNTMVSVWVMVTHRPQKRTGNQRYISLHCALTSLSRRKICPMAPGHAGGLLVAVIKSTWMCQAKSLSALRVG